MANTFLTMQTRIADELVNEPLTTAQIKNAIISAIGDYENTSFYFNQKRGTLSVPTFNTVSGQEFYTSTSNADIPNISKFFSASASLSSSWNSLEAIDFDEIERTQTGAIIGFPIAYAYFNQQIRLYPIPDAIYPVSISYTYKFTTLSADADTNAWVDDAEEMIRQAAKYRLAMDVLHADDIAARCMRMEQNAYDGLMQETRQKYPNTTLRIPSMQSSRTFNINRGY